MELSLNFHQIQAEREGRKEFGRDLVIEYPMDLYIQGVKHEDDGKAVVSFRLQTTASPDVASFILAGDLSLSGTEEEVRLWTTPTREGPPKVWRHIYQEGINILTVLAKVIDVPFPIPEIGGITVDNQSYKQY